MINLTEDNIQNIISDATAEGKPLFIDFYAEWCGPCKMIEPVIDEISNEYGERIIFVKLNVDDNPQSAAYFGVRSIPTLLLINKNGEMVNRHSGAAPKSVIVGFLKKIL